MDASEHRSLVLSDSSTFYRTRARLKNIAEGDWNVRDEFTRQHNNNALLVVAWRGALLSDLLMALKLVPLDAFDRIIIV